MDMFTLSKLPLLDVLHHREDTKDLPTDAELKTGIVHLVAKLFPVVLPLLALVISVSSLPVPEAHCIIGNFNVLWCHGLPN